MVAARQKVMPPPGIEPGISALLVQDVQVLRVTPAPRWRPLEPSEWILIGFGLRSKNYICLSTNEFQEQRTSASAAGTPERQCRPTSGRQILCRTEYNKCRYRRKHVLLPVKDLAQHSIAKIAWPAAEPDAEVICNQHPHCQFTAM